MIQKQNFKIGILFESIYYLAFRKYQITKLRQSFVIISLVIDCSNKRFSEAYFAITKSTRSKSKKQLRPNFFLIVPTFQVKKPTQNRIDILIFQSYRLL